MSTDNETSKKTNTYIKYTGDRMHNQSIICHMASMSCGHMFQTGYYLLCVKTAVLNNTRKFVTMSSLK